MNTSNRKGNRSSFKSNGCLHWQWRNQIVPHQIEQQKRNAVITCTGVLNGYTWRCWPQVVLQNKPFFITNSSIVLKFLEVLHFSTSIFFNFYLHNIRKEGIILTMHSAFHLNLYNTKRSINRTDFRISSVRFPL